MCHSLSLEASRAHVASLNRQVRNQWMQAPTSYPSGWQFWEVLSVLLLRSPGGIQGPSLFLPFTSHSHCYLTPADCKQELPLCFEHKPHRVLSPENSWYKEESGRSTGGVGFQFNVREYFSNGHNYFCADYYNCLPPSSICKLCMRLWNIVVLCLSVYYAQFPVYCRHSINACWMIQKLNGLQSTFEQHRCELHKSTFTCIFFNT